MLEVKERLAVCSLNRKIFIWKSVADDNVVPSYNLTDPSFPHLACTSFKNKKRWSTCDFKRPELLSCIAARTSEDQENKEEYESKKRMNKAGEKQNKEEEEEGTK